MHHDRLTDSIAEWVADALAADPGLERVHWDVSFQLIPTPQGAQPAFPLLLLMPSPILGQTLSHVVLLGIDATAERVDAGLREAIEQLRQRRSQALAPSNGSGLLR